MLNLQGTALVDQDGRLMGLNELHKGGYAHGKVKNSREEAIAQLERYVIPEHIKVRDELAATLAGKFDYGKYEEPLDSRLLPLRGHARQWIPGGQLLGNQLPLRADLSPERRAHVFAVSNVDRRRRGTEEMMYDLIKANAPMLAELPVWRETWRLMHKRPAAEETEASGPAGAPDAAIPGIADTRWANRFMREYIRSHTEIMNVVREAVRDDFLQAIGLSDERASGQAVRFNPKSRAKVLMRLFLLAVRPTTGAPYDPVGRGVTSIEGQDSVRPMTRTTSHPWGRRGFMLGLGSAALPFSPARRRRGSGCR